MAKNESSKSKAEIYREERKERLAKAAKKNAKNIKTRTTAISIAKKVAAVLVAVAIVAGIGWFIVDHFGIDRKMRTALTVGDTKVSVAQFDYYYNMSYQYFAQMESSYQQQGMSMGFPLDKAPNEVSSGQKDEAGNELMYDQAIAQYAANLAFQQFSLYNEAKAANYSLTPEEQAQIDEVIASLEKQATEGGSSLNAFIRSSYSKGLNEKGLRELLEVELLATRYNDDMQTKANESVTKEQVEAEYKENVKTYNYTNLRYYKIDIPAITKADGELDEEFNQRKADEQKKATDAANAVLAKATDAETLKAAALEHKNADLKEGTKPTEVDPTVENKYMTHNTFKTTVSEEAADWLFDASRKAGDKKVFTTEKAAFVVLVDAPSFAGNNVDVRHCLIKFDVAEGKTPTEDQKKATHAEAVKVQEEWIKNGRSEDAFKAIVKKYNEDTASTENGGLYEGIIPSSNYVDNFKFWAIDPARKEGDCDIIESSYGYHIMYFVKNNGADWETTALSKLQEEAYTNAFEALMGENGKYSMVKNEKNIAKASEDFCDKLKKSLAQQASQQTITL